MHFVQFSITISLLLIDPNIRHIIELKGKIGSILKVDDNKMHTLLKFYVNFFLYIVGVEKSKLFHWMENYELHSVDIYAGLHHSKLKKCI